jgi:DNA primase
MQLVNKVIRDRIFTLERKQPLEEARRKKCPAQLKQLITYDSTFTLLFKDELQERELARILLSEGLKKWNQSKLVAE